MKNCNMKIAETDNKGDEAAANAHNERLSMGDMSTTIIAFKP